MSLENRVGRLEAMLPQEVPWDQVYDCLWDMEMTIGCPPGSSGEDEALQRLGDRETFINDRRAD